MYDRIEAFFKNNNLTAGKCLVVGDTLRGGKGNPSLFNMLPKGCDLENPDYPGVDIQCMPYGDNTFDFVLSDQVLEHVEKPWVAAEEIYRVLKPSGIAVITTCLINEIHGVPNDYFRFTPDGLKVLFNNFSKIHQVDGHGDLNFVIKCLKGKRGQQILPGSPEEIEALVYDKKFMLGVWIIAEK